MIHVHRFTAALDCGTVVQPTGVLAQVEGGLMFGLSAVLHEEITFQNGDAEQRNFHNYQILSPSESPEVFVEIIPSNEPPGGLGEISVGPVAASVTNAIFAATGLPCRNIPIQNRLESLQES
jgi:isoquinoline 1-oxidoreductase subunit beta